MTSYKLLGVTIEWADHIATVTSKAAKRLWFLKKLKPAGVSQEDLVYTKLLFDLCLSMRARYGIPVSQANSRSPWTPSSEGPAKSSLATGHTATPALF